MLAFAKKSHMFLRGTVSGMANDISRNRLKYWDLALLGRVDGFFPLAGLPGTYLNSLR
jgi:hypothetical protein